MLDKSEQPPITEMIPGRAGLVSALASAHAPFVYFDLVSSFGECGGVVNLTLEAVRHMEVQGHSTFDRVVVAHLRTSQDGLRSLADAVTGIALLGHHPGSEPS